MFKREKFLHELLELNPFCLFLVIDKDGKVLDFNDNFGEKFGWGQIEAIGRCWFEVVDHPAFPFQPIQMQAILDGNFNQDEAFIAYVDGTKITSKWKVWPSKEQEVIFLYGVDTSELIEQLNSTKSYLNGIINNIPYNIFWKDHQSHFLGCNKTFAELAGLECPEEIVGKSDYDLPWSKEESDVYVKDDQFIMETGIAKLNYEEAQTLADGSKKVGLVSKVPLKDEQGNALGIFCIYTDITALKEKEAALIEANRQAQAALQSKNDFILNMEHDLRTPFNGLYGLTKILCEDERDPAKKELLGHVMESAKALLEHCDSVLDFAKVDQAIVTPAMYEKFNLKALVEQVVAIERPACLEKRLQFLLECEENIPEVIFGYRHGVSQILLNLLSNAIKFTKNGYVKLKIAVNRKIKDNDRISIKFIVQDSGIGIPLDKQQVIYEKFMRLSESNAGTYGGLGLGLALTKKLITSMQGEIRLQSKEGKGTTFTCILPFGVRLDESAVHRTLTTS
jgi:PAS domain S-box-containing protein